MAAEQSNATPAPLEGNAVFSASTTLKTSDLYSTGQLPERFDNPDAFKGYGTAKGAQNPMYMTSNSMYGHDAPSVHTMPAQFHGVNQRFSSHMAQAGMPRSTGLSTAKDASRVHDALKP
eukprot:m.62916 g.62916  ORF g.62916 m.62916 type:complete len:119 (+) comp13940_c0_seq2:96-452(+)